jgi:hypothetical protein
MGIADFFVGECLEIALDLTLLFASIASRSFFLSLVSLSLVQFSYEQISFGVM